jgi:hypothetical protein
MKAWRRLLRCVLIVLLTAAATARADQLPSTRTKATADLGTVDKAFLSAYERAAKTVLADAPPTFLVLPEKLVLYRDENRHQLPLLPPSFNELKTISHVALALFAIISPANATPLGVAERAELERYRDSLIPKALAAIRQVGLPAAQLERQQQILAASLALANQVLARGQIADADLTGFCRRMRPLLEANVGDAVRAYLDELNRQMQTILPQFSEAERQSFLVIVTGVHQARQDNAVMQYFQRLLGDPETITQRLMYAENVADEAGTLRLLGIHVMAKRVGKAFFADPYYMNRDLFAGPASAYLPTMQLPSLTGERH